MSPPIILYQPRAEGKVLPLGLVHVGSMVPEERVVIIDGRVELAPEAQVVELGGDALCLGVSVVTGAPILDALRVSRAAKSTNPRLPVIWGGWHPSLLAEQCLASGVVDACVIGQGERTLATIVGALREGRSFDGIPGVTWKRGGEVVRNAARPFEDVNGFPAADFGLLDMERFFRFRGARRLDYCSSQGSVAEDAAGAEPSVCGRGFSGLAAERVVNELKELVGRYRLSEVVFKDDDFFADLRRTEEISRGLIESGVRVRWSAAGRADRLGRLADEQLRLLRASGCSRVTVGTGAARGARPRESTQGTLSEEALEAASKLHRAGIGACFLFTVGSPKEAKDSLAAIYRTAKAIREIDGEFETPISFYAPDPGRGLPEGGAPPDFASPATLEDWQKLDFDHWIGPWIPESVRRAVLRYNFYLGHGYRKPSRRVGKRLLHYLARARVKTNFYAFDWERRAVDLSQRLRTGKNRQPSPVPED
jgi:anaerobic magnesium-protoporphyrin IX monomethyl ester cyclase